MKRLAAALICIIFSVPLFAAGEPMAFMNNRAGVRSLGFGNAGTGVGGDNDSIIFNPAGLVHIPDLQMNFETYLMSFGRSMNYVAASKPFLVGANTFAAAVSWIGYSAGSDLELRKTDSPEPEGSFNDSSNLFALSAATTISERLSAGVNLKLFVQSLYTARATGVGFDAGLLLKPSKESGIGLTFTDISSSVGWSNSAKPEQIPLKISAGASYIFYSSADSYIMPVLDIRMDSSGSMEASGGIESFIFDMLYLRAGYENAFCFGTGVFIRASKVFTLKINYAMKFDTILTGEGDHRLGAVFDYVFPHKAAEPAKAVKHDENKPAGGYDW